MSRNLCEEQVKECTMCSLPLPPLIPNLPDDITSRCIALLPLSSHPSLSLVSRSWRSLLRSHSFFSLRSHFKEPVLFLIVRTPSNPSLCFLLHPSLPRNPQPISPPPFPTVGSTCCTLGPLIYLLGGSHNNIPTRAVQIFDPRTQQWASGPSMSATREFPAAASIGGQIYAIGGCLPSNPFWAESLDPTGCWWGPVPSPIHIRDKWMHGNAVLDGKILAVADRGGVVFDPRTFMWGPVSTALDLGWKGRAAVVGGILYSYDYLGKIKGYDPCMDQWRKVEGLDQKLPKFLCGATLASLGGLLCLVWERSGTRKAAVEKSRVSGAEEISRWRKMMVEKYNIIGAEEISRWWNVVEISCAGIEISRMQDGGLKGSVIWLEKAILDVPRGSTIAHCISVQF